MLARFLTFALLAVWLAPSDVFAGLRTEWARDLHNKQIEATVALYAADGVFIQPDGTRVEGRDAIRKLLKTITATFDSDLVFQSNRVEVSGSIAYDSGTYSEKLVNRADGKQMHSKGSYLTVYRKQGGAWKIVEQAWTGAIENSSQP